MSDLTQEQLAQLVGGGECFIHMHPKEQLDFSDRLELMNAAPRNSTSSDYSLTKADELVLVDTSANDATITLPLADKGREFQVVKVSPLNTLYVAPTNPDTVLGSTTGIAITTLFTSLHFKSVSGGYILI